MDPLGAWSTVIASGALLVVTVLVLRQRLPRRWVDALTAVAGGGIGLGGLLFLHDVGPASWVVAPLVLAVAAVAHVRFLFAPGGPFRT